MQNYHRPATDLSSEARDFIRALNSFKEVIEAIDWYQQQADASNNKQLKKNCSITVLFLGKGLK